MLIQSKATLRCYLWVPHLLGSQEGHACSKCLARLQLVISAAAQTSSKSCLTSSTLDSHQHPHPHTPYLCVEHLVLHHVEIHCEEPRLQRGTERVALHQTNLRIGRLVTQQVLLWWDHVLKDLEERRRATH